MLNIFTNWIIYLTFTDVSFDDPFIQMNYDLNHFWQTKVKVMVYKSVEIGRRVCRRFDDIYLIGTNICKSSTRVWKWQTRVQVSSGGGFERESGCGSGSGPGVRTTILVSLLSQGLRRGGGRSDAGGATHNRP